MKVDRCQIYCFIVLFDSVFVVVKKIYSSNYIFWGALSIYIQIAGNPSHFWTVNRQNQEWLANGPKVSRELNSPWTKPYKARNIRKKNFWNWGLLGLSVPGLFLLFCAHWWAFLPWALLFSWKITWWLIPLSKWVSSPQWFTWDQ